VVFWLTENAPLAVSPLYRVNLTKRSSCFKLPLSERAAWRIYEGLCWMLPPFNGEGVLPPADYPLTLGQLRDSLLVIGPEGKSEHWDAVWRGHLVANLGILVKQLWTIGISDIFIDGSFVEDRDCPNDIDGYFVCDVNRVTSGLLANELNNLAPHPVWTWDHKRRKPDRRGKSQLPMWHQYRVELFPHYGQPNGIVDKHGNELTFPSSFRLTRGGVPKGIIKLEAGHDPE
jgi:hypothetical protein